MKTKRPSYTRLKPWDKIYFGKRKVTRLTDEYAFDPDTLKPIKNYTPWNFGEYPVGKITSYGKAIFEVHYNFETDHARVFLVA